MTIDVIYLAWNRLEFTRATFPILLANTNWDMVRHLRVYDDGSTDGTREYLDAAIKDAPCDAGLSHLGFGSPVATMNHYVSGDDPADAFAKIDSDIACPVGWLDALAGVMEANVPLEILGMQAGMTGETDGEYGWTESSHIGGVGLMRTSAFLRRKNKPYPNSRFGFTSWQHKEDVVRGWITPDLLCPQLDLLPNEPWVTYSDEYVARGWQRSWPKLSLAGAEHHARWFLDQAAAL